MNNVLKKIATFLGSKDTYAVVIFALIITAIGAGLYVSYFDNSNQTTVLPGDDSDTVLVEDIRSGTIEVDKYDYPVSTIKISDFTELEDGTIFYDGESYLGIDVSEHQGVIDWAAVKADGIEFAMIRVGYRGATRGDLYEDAQFVANIEGAIENGIEVGVYFFSQATTVEEAEEEAVFVLEAISDYRDYVVYPIVFDWEHVSITDNRTDNIEGTDVALFAKAFCTKITKSGLYAMVYVNKSLGYTFYNLNAISDYPLWVAEYEEAPSFYYYYEIWQYTDSGSVDGIEGDVDMNIAFEKYS